MSRVGFSIGFSGEETAWLDPAEFAGLSVDEACERILECLDRPQTVYWDPDDIQAAAEVLVAGAG